MKFGTTDARMAQCLIREVCGLALMPDEHDRRVVQLLKLPENLLQACFEALVGPRTVVVGEDTSATDGWWQTSIGGPVHVFKDGHALCDHSIISDKVLRFTDVPDGACAACLLRMEPPKEALRDEPPAPTARPDWIETPDWFDKKYGGREYKTGTIYNLLMDLAQILKPHREDKVTDLGDGLKVNTSCICPVCTENRSFEEALRRVGGHYVKIVKEANKKQRLSEVVTAQEVVDALRKEYGVTINPRYVLDVGMAFLGLRDVRIRRNMAEGTVKVWVVRNEG